MPNTLAHFGIQTVASKAVNRSVDVKWIGVGCIIPDIPWIIQRLVSAIPGIDLLSLRIYSMIQASLFFCLILCAVIALLTRSPRYLFLLLAGNSLAHLLLDAAQTKWANGVHLLAPVSWQLSQYSLFWPESVVTIVLSAGGLVIIFYYGWQERYAATALKHSFCCYLLSFSLFLCYMLLPFAFFNAPFEADNHYVRTIRDMEQRAGKTIGFDRGRYDSATATVSIFTGERIKLISAQPISDGMISLRGRFADPNTIVAATVHQHGGNRDALSYAGLSILLILWANALLRQLRKPV
jgi:hypothetical protein